MQKRMIIGIAIVLLYSCTAADHSLPPGSKAWLDSVIQKSDSSFKKPYFRQDFVTAYYYLNRKDSTVSQVMKDSSERIRQIVTTKNDTRTYYARFFANGQQQGIWPLDNTGQLNGEITNYFENGKIESKGMYMHGLKTGDWKTYDSLGKLISTDHFDEKGQLQNNNGGTSN